MYLELPTKKYGVIKFQISEQDLALIKDLTLYISYTKQTNSFYIMTSDRKYLHRIITNAQKGQVVDHINHDTLDNRRENLRVVIHAENRRNSLKSYTDTQKLSREEIKEILLSSESNNKLAQKYNVSNCLIANIRTGEIYKNYHPEIPRKQKTPRNPLVPITQKKAIKNTVMNYQGSLYQLSKALNMPSSKLYQIRKGTIWKNI